MSTGVIDSIAYIALLFVLFIVSFELLKYKQEERKKIDVDKLTKGLSKQQIRDLIIKLSEKLR